MRVLGFILVRQLWDRRFLNGIAMGAVTLGVIVLLVIKGIMHGFQDKFYDAILNISAHVTIMDKELRPAPQILTRYYGGPIASVVAHESPPDRPVRIRRPREMVRDAERIDGILAASALLVGPAALRFGTRELSVDLRGIQPDPQTRVTGVAPYVVAGSYRQLSQVPDGILLGTGVATRLGAKLEDVVLCSSSVGRRLGLRVIGIFDAGVPPLDNTRAYVSLGTAQALFGQPDSVNRIEIRIRDPDRAFDLAHRVETAFGYHAESWQEVNANLLGIFNLQALVSSFVVAALLCTGGFAILAIQVMIVLQKTRDIAILRSIGFQRGDIMAIVLVQGMILAIVGGLVGCLIGHGLVLALSLVRTHQEGVVKSEHLLMHDDPRMYVYAVVFTFIVGVVASLLPALRASSVEPVEVLRGQIG